MYLNSWKKNSIFNEFYANQNDENERKRKQKMGTKERKGMSVSEKKKTIEKHAKRRFNTVCPSQYVKNADSVTRHH